jgi:hypothetical protein
MMKEFMSASVFTAFLAAFATAIPRTRTVEWRPLRRRLPHLRIQGHRCGRPPRLPAVEATLKAFGGRFVVRGGKVDSLEGSPVSADAILTNWGVRIKTWTGFMPQVQGSPGIR